MLHHFARCRPVRRIDLHDEPEKRGRHLPCLWVQIRQKLFRPKWRILSWALKVDLSFLIENALDNLRVPLLKDILGERTKHTNNFRQMLLLTIQSLEYLRDEAGLDVTLVDGSGKTALEYSRERAKKRHHEYTFDCSRWRRTESLLASWAERNRESLAEAYKVGKCPEELHYSDNSALYSLSKISIGWT